jgi:hypothetical protein
VPVEIPQKYVSQPDGQVADDEADDSAPSTSNSATARIATAQLHLQSKIDILNSDLVGLYERQKRGMLTQEQDVELKEKKSKKMNWKSS